MAFTSDDITDVFLTHLHFDHCGGSIVKDGDKLVPAFKNATYWSNREHWDWAVNPNEREKASFLKENILPIKESGQLKFIDTANAENTKLGEILFCGEFFSSICQRPHKGNDASAVKI